eukprot:1010021-Rhodomonas_salina.4
MQEECIGSSRTSAWDHTERVYRIMQKECAVCYREVRGSVVTDVVSTQIQHGQSVAPLQPGSNARSVGAGQGGEGETGKEIGTNCPKACTRNRFLLQIVLKRQTLVFEFEVEGESRDLFARRSISSSWMSVLSRFKCAIR